MRTVCLIFFQTYPREMSPPSHILEDNWQFLWVWLGKNPFFFHHVRKSCLRNLLAKKPVNVLYFCKFMTYFISSCKWLLRRSKIYDSILCTLHSKPVIWMKPVSDLTGLSLNTSSSYYKFHLAFYILKYHISYSLWMNRLLCTVDNLLIFIKYVNMCFFRLKALKLAGHCINKITSLQNHVHIVGK